jgi:hypothetical protein
VESADASRGAVGLALVLTILAEVLRRARPWRVLAWAKSCCRERDAPRQSPDSGTRQAGTAAAGHPLNLQHPGTHVHPGQ